MPRGDLSGFVRRELPKEMAQTVVLAAPPEEQELA